MCDVDSCPFVNVILHPLIKVLLLDLVLLPLLRSQVSFVLSREERIAFLKKNKVEALDQKVELRAHPSFIDLTNQLPFILEVE